MTVYADVLILVNFIVDYFLLLLTAKFLHIKAKVLRIILASLSGGLFSLYILLPQSNFLLQTFIHICMCAALCLIAFGFKDIKAFLRGASALFCVNFAYSGAMIAVWLIFKPYGMVINNSVVYFDISPLFLILFSVVGYFAVLIIRKFIKKPFSQNTYCDVTVYCGPNSFTLCGIADTGNSLNDAFGFSQIFITEEAVVDALLGKQKQNPTRFRKIPCSTVAGDRLLDGYRIDRAVVKFNNKNYAFKNPILAVSATPLNDCKIIVNPEILN